jgi:hypothetical protein
MVRSMRASIPQAAVEPGIPVYLAVDSRVKTYTASKELSEYGVFFLGRITYADARGITREAGFIRRFDTSGGGSWKPISESGYDYAY